MSSKKIFVLGVAISLVIAASALFYYLTVYIPQRDQKQRETEQRTINQIFNTTQAESDRKKTIKDCETVATSQARNLLKSKIELVGQYSSAQLGAFQKAYDQGLYLQADYDNYFQQCLFREGIITDYKDTQTK